MSTLITSYSSNGWSATSTQETCLQRIARDTGHYHREFWIEALTYCHVPHSAPAWEWEDGILRVKLCADTLIRKEHA